MRAQKILLPIIAVLGVVVFFSVFVIKEVNGVEVSNLAEIIIGKQRHGPTGNIMLEFEAMFTKFKDTQIS